MSRGCVALRTSVKRPGGFVPVAALLTLLLADPARGTVLEIANDGSVIIHAPPSSAAKARRIGPPVIAPAVRPTRAAPLGLRPHFDAASTSFELSAELIEAVAWAESRFDQAAVSQAGARGVMQLMPGTARELGVDPRDPRANIHGGTGYLRMLLNRYAGDIVKTLAAYNAGPGTVDRYGGVPPYRETRAYVEAILARLAARAAD